MFTMAQKFFLVSGSGDAISPLNAFDKALLFSGIGNTNLIKISSILPPGAREIEVPKIPMGAFLPVAYASIISDIPGELIAAAVAVAIPKDDRFPGVITEHSAHGHKEDVEEVARMMAKQAMIIRDYEILKISSIGIQHRVEKIGAAFAAVALWW